MLTRLHIRIIQSRLLIYVAGSDPKQCGYKMVRIQNGADVDRYIHSYPTLLYMIILIIFIISYPVFRFTLFPDYPSNLHSFGFILVIPLLVYFSRQPLARPWDSALHVRPTCPLAIL